MSCPVRDPLSPRAPLPKEGVQLEFQGGALCRKGAQWLFVAVTGCRHQEKRRWQGLNVVAGRGAADTLVWGQREHRAVQEAAPLAASL